jgi:hypothetical protein
MEGEMGKAIFNIILIVIVLLVVCIVWPFFTKSRVNYDLEKAASYGTKHSVEETRKFLTKALNERGINYSPDDLFIEKSANDTVTISLSYEDSIHFFSIVLKELDFELEVKQKNIKEMF